MHTDATPAGLTPIPEPNTVPAAPSLRMSVTPTSAASFENVNCLLCGEHATDTLVADGTPTRIVRCKNDGLVYLSPRPTHSHIRAFHHQFVRQDNLDLFDSYRRRTLEREARTIQQLKRSGTLLDIGCATGTFLEHFSAPSWRVHGVETSPVGAELARTRTGADLSCGTLREAAYSSKYFDVVTVLDTLFYFPSPLEELGEIRRILKDDGLLAIEIPGFRHRKVRDRGLICYLVDGEWSRISPRNPDLYYFSPATLRALLEATGFRIRRVIPQQAPTRRNPLLQWVNHLHFNLNKGLFAITRGRTSFSAKEMYIVEKT